MNKWEKIAAVKNMTAAERLAFYSVKGGVGGCWTWIGPIMKATPANPRGLPYGRFRFSGRAVLAHRLAWELRNGPIPAGMAVLHRCDNPKCINPEHLFTGTQEANVADRNDKLRHAHGVTHGSAKLDDEKVRQIRREAKSDSEWASLFSVTKSTVRHARNRLTWKHVE
jgi:hypothetical protein